MQRGSLLLVASVHQRSGTQPKAKAPNCKPLHTALAKHRQLALQGAGLTILASLSGIDSWMVPIAESLSVEWRILGRVERCYTPLQAQVHDKQAPARRCRAV